MKVLCCRQDPLRCNSVPTLQYVTHYGLSHLVGSPIFALSRLYGQRQRYLHTCRESLLQFLPSAGGLRSCFSSGVVRSCWLAGGTHPPPVLGADPRPRQLHHARHLVVSEDVLPHDQLVVAQRHLGQRLPLLGLFHEFPQLSSLVSHLLGEILSNVDITASQKLGLPASKRTIRQLEISIIRCSMQVYYIITILLELMLVYLYHLSNYN